MQFRFPERWNGISPKMEQMMRDRILDGIKELFAIRDHAIATKDKTLFLSTQLANSEISKSGSVGYLQTEKIISTILFLHNDEKDPPLWVALVKEDYYHEGKYSHRGYLLYKIVEKEEKVLIKEISY